MGLQMTMPFSVSLALLLPALVAWGEEPLWLVLLPLGVALLLALVVGLLERREAGAPKFEPARLAAFASTLAWITVAAAGRWIGFT